MVKNTDSLSVFKNRLDKHLKKIPDLHPVQGYVTSNKNSLLDWAVCSWEGKRDIGRLHSSADDDLLDDEPTANGEEHHAT